MMRVCHLDTCPVGVATQNPELRKRFTGQPGSSSPSSSSSPSRCAPTSPSWASARSTRPSATPSCSTPARPWTTGRPPASTCRRCWSCPSCPRARRYPVKSQDHGLDIALDQTLIQLCEGALLDARPVTLELPVRNVNRTVGTMLGSMVTRRFGGEGLPDGTIDLTFGGSAGQSFGAFLPRGITMRLFGDANDYVGKGLSGGRIVVRPSRRRPSPRRTTSSPATSSATAPPAGRSSCAAGWGSGSACATPGRWPSSRRR